MNFLPNDTVSTAYSNHSNLKDLNAKRRTKKSAMNCLEISATIEGWYRQLVSFDEFIIKYLLYVPTNAQI